MKSREESVSQKRRRLRTILEKLRRAHPDARLALDFTNPLELLIALILAAQARDDLVNSVTADLFPRYRSASDWAHADPQQLQEELRRINFYRNKAKAIQKVTRALEERFDGQVPDRLDDLVFLPGVGRKTANILLGNAFGQPAIGVDTHVARLAQRLDLTRQTDPDKIEADLNEIVPASDAVSFCHLLQFHGRRICRARKPDCPDCPIASLCPFPDKAQA